MWTKLNKLNQTFRPYDLVKGNRKGGKVNSLMDHQNDEG